MRNLKIILQYSLHPLTYISLYTYKSMISAIIVKRAKKCVIGKINSVVVRLIRFVTGVPIKIYSAYVTMC